MSAVMAGRELDALVAEKVMGFVWKRSSWTFGHPPRHARVLILPSVAAQYGDSDLHGDESDERAVERVPHYSTDIAAVWTVVTKLRADGWCLAVHEELYTDGAYQWVATFVRGASDEYEDTGEELAPTAPLAICRAALQAIEVQP